MSTLVDDAVDALRSLPPLEQADLARVILALTETMPPPLAPAEARAIAEAEDEIARGKRIPDETIAAFWKAHGV